jgi:hypothetical protein
MINERSSAQSNTPTSANMQYGYATGKNTSDKSTYQFVASPSKEKERQKFFFSITHIELNIKCML